MHVARGDGARGFRGSSRSRLAWRADDDQCGQEFLARGINAWRPGRDVADLDPAARGRFARRGAIFATRRVDSESQWHPIAGPEASDALLKIRQLVIVSDAQLMEGGAASVPAAEGMTSLLYVMDGAIRVGDARLRTGDTVTDLDGTWPVVHAESAATLVAFVVVRSAPASTAGTISRR